MIDYRIIEKMADKILSKDPTVMKFRLKLSNGLISERLINAIKIDDKPTIYRVTQTLYKGVGETDLKGALKVYSKNVGSYSGENNTIKDFITVLLEMKYEYVDR